MAEMLLVDSLKELRTLIDEQHLLYLELVNQNKIDQRHKLENYIKDYLCLAPHDAKFTYHQTAEVLHQSASIKKNFCAYKAVAAWKAIGKYADNLVIYPWRKEYKDLKLYCGFYKHEIERSLASAELMFEAMGYRHTGPSSMTLSGILDPDRITSVSKDAIIASVECQIMKQIWETLPLHFNITWLEILEFRENHTGTPDQVIRALTYKYHQKQYQEQIYHRSHIQNIDNHPHQLENHFEQYMGYYSHPMYPNHTYYHPVQCRHGSLISPQHVPPSPMYPSTTLPPSYGSSHHVLKPHDVYPTNGYEMNSHYPQPMGLQHVPHNGYSIVPLLYPVPSIVPTGKLIELDPSPTHNVGETYFQRSNVAKYNSPLEESTYLLDCLKNSRPNVSNRAKDDGAGSWENWDYVYRNLESQGYKAEPESADENQLSSSQNNSSEVDSLNQTDITNRIRKLNVDTNSQGRTETNSSKSRTEPDEEIKAKNFKEKIKTESEKSNDNKKLKDFKFSKISPKKESRKNSEIYSPNNSAFSNGSSCEKIENEYLSVSGESNNSRYRNETTALIVNLDDEDEKWQCVTCTYLNSVAKNVCEMCYKSRERGSEITPQPSGGAECPKCTLVNEPGLSVCAACQSSLKDSPTYI